MKHGREREKENHLSLAKPYAQAHNQLTLDRVLGKVQYSSIKNPTSLISIKKKMNQKLSIVEDLNCIWTGHSICGEGPFWIPEEQAL